MGRRRGKDSRVRHKQSTKQEILIKADKKKKNDFSVRLMLISKGNEGIGNSNHFEFVSEKCRLVQLTVLVIVQFRKLQSRREKPE